MYLAREVKIGNIVIGGKHPIRIQSMTNTNTSDIMSTVEQVIRLSNAGCELVRIAARTVKEVNDLGIIKKLLKGRGYDLPLIADIHFQKNAAEAAARIVEKVRINPGNYIGKFEDYDLDYIAKELKPLIEICKVHDTAIRVGVNQGSLGRRIINHYGNTTEGLVESALEFARVFDLFQFNKLVLSVKSSNIKTMIESYKQLAIRLKQEKLNFPLHVGLTEAGISDEGDIRSLIGINAVLSYGIGDTIRVSLTGDPLKEIPVAKEILRIYSSQKNEERKVQKVPEMELFTLNSSPKVNVELIDSPLIIKKGDSFYKAYHNGRTMTIKDSDVTIIRHEKEIEKFKDFCDASLKGNSKLIVIIAKDNQAHKIISKIKQSGIYNPLFLMNHKKMTLESDLLYENARFPGSLLAQGYADGLCLDSHLFPNSKLIDIGYRILQASRRYLTTIEYISCPSCSRTSFDIETRLHEIKHAISHLKGLKIAVMGCIVNGPGEMADADYGYVGSGKGRINLYKGKELIKKNIAEMDAITELIKEIEKYELQKL